MCILLPTPLYLLLQLGGVQSMYDGLEGGVKQVRAMLAKVKEEVQLCPAQAEC